MSVWEKEGRKESELEVLRKHTSISRRPFAHPSPLERGTRAGRGDWIYTSHPLFLPLHSQAKHFLSGGSAPCCRAWPLRTHLLFWH